MDMPKHSGSNGAPHQARHTGSPAEPLDEHLSQLKFAFEVTFFLRSDGCGYRETAPEVARKQPSCSERTFRCSESSRAASNRIRGSSQVSIAGSVNISPRDEAGRFSAIVEDRLQPFAQRLRELRPAPADRAPDCFAASRASSKRESLFAMQMGLRPLASAMHC